MTTTGVDRSAGPSGSVATKAACQYRTTANIALSRPLIVRWDAATKGDPAILASFDGKRIRHQLPEQQAVWDLFLKPKGGIPMLPLMEDIEARFPGIRAFSLPSMGDGQDGRPARRHIELGVKGDPALVERAFADMQRGVEALGAPSTLA